MTDQEIIEVVTAHSQGKQIQYSSLTGTYWVDCDDSRGPAWNFLSRRYRVKPAEPRTCYRFEQETLSGPELSQTAYPTAELAEKYGRGSFFIRAVKFVEVL